MDLDRGISRGGFGIVTVTKDTFTVEYYTADRGKDVPFVVTTPKGGSPTFITSPFAITHDILQETDGSSVAFRKLLQQRKQSHA